MLTLYDKNDNVRNLVESTDFIKGNKSTKFPDGTMIVTGYRQHRITSDDVYSGKIEVLLEDAFIGDFFPIITNIYSHSNNVIYSADGDVAENKFNVYFYSINPLNNGNSVYFRYIAIGRWK